MICAWAESAGAPPLATPRPTPRASRPDTPASGENQTRSDSSPPRLPSRYARRPASRRYRSLPAPAAPQAPRPIARRRTRAAQRIKQCRLAPDPIDQPERRRVRSDRTERRLLIRTARRSDKQSPPSASITARSRTTRPGSCRPRRSRTPTNATERSRVSPTRSATSPSNAAPAWETKPSPSAATSTVKLRPLRCTFKVNLPSRSCGRRTPTESPLRRTVPRPRPSGPQLLHERSGLRPFGHGSEFHWL